MTSANEKCVKEIIELLETTNAASRQTSANSPSSPANSTGMRAVEPKSTEKCTTAPAMPNTATGDTLSACSHAKIVGNLVRSAKNVNATVENDCGADMPVITVNNTISIAGAAATEDLPVAHKPGNEENRQESVYAAAKDAIQQQQQKIATQLAKTKVVRNRNVDLALEIVKGQQQRIEKDGQNNTHVTNGVLIRDAKDALKEATENVRPILTTFSQQHDKLKGVSRKEKKNKKNRPLINGSMAGENKTIKEEVADDIENSNHTTDSQRMVKWSSINTTFDEKFYVTNDMKLKQKKIYDEMEFEEFEVCDPITGASTGGGAGSTPVVASDCYDSLNSNK